MDKAKLTSEDVWAMFAETDRRMQETGRQIEETGKQMKETDRRFKETDLKFKETDLKFKETERLIEKNANQMKELGIYVAGISNSNGKFAEELFYDSLEKSKTFAGVHYDAVSNVFGGTERMPDGTMLQDQFDIVMINDNAVAIIEIKYKADSDYPKKMAKEKVNNFKVLFPYYKDFKIYLGLGSLVFEKRVVDEAKKYGVGLLKQKGNTIEYKTDWIVRAY